MQVASRHCLWADGNPGTEITVEMTPYTGLYINFDFNAVPERDVAIDWGDGTVNTVSYASGDISRGHTYPAYGRYVIVFRGAKSIGFRTLDGVGIYDWDAAIISFVDRSGDIVKSQSGAFQSAVNLERFIAPNCAWMGQRDFARCSNLREVQIGRNKVLYDGTFQNCTSLVKYTTIDTGRCWRYVWQGCSSLRELRLGKVSQFANAVFQGTHSLTDIYISDKTVDQIRQIAPEGNIEAGYNAMFPWGAAGKVRFHGTDGIVLGNRTIVSA